jgi:drug/metabolite transporter (DMT)-like permease
MIRVPTGIHETMPHLAMFVAMVLGASSFPAGKAAVAAMPASEILVIRFALAALILWCAVAVLRHTPGTRRFVTPAFLVGIVEPGLATNVVYWGLLSTTAVHATVIFALTPLVTSVMGRILLKETISPAVIVGAFFALVGTVLLVSDDPGRAGSLKGDLLCTLGLALISSAQVAIRHLVRRHADPLTVTANQITGGAVACLVIMVGFESWIGGVGWVAVPSGEIWLLIAYLAVIVSAALFFLNAYALSHIPVGQVGLYFVLLAPLGVPMAVILLGETVTRSDIAAIALVAGGVALPRMLTMPWFGPLRVSRLPAGEKRQVPPAP